jgi:HAD superfamily hydrolase (TIGR01509 family)
VKQLALFDMDGLLFDTERLFLSLTDQTEAEIGYSIPRELHMEAIGRSFADVSRLFRDHFGPDFPTQTFFHRTKERVNAHVREHGMPVKPGVPELLAALADRSVRRVLASSSPLRLIRESLSAAGMTNTFSSITGGDEVERGKPAPDIFLLAARRAGTDPADCVVFEDSNNGVRAARAAGMRAVMVPDIKEPEEEVRGMAFGVYADLHAVLEELDRILL